MEETTVKSITAEEFAELDHSKYTLVDLREKDEVLIKPVEGAVNIPFSGFPGGLSELPQDKTVYVFCREGSFSEEVVEILTDRGYDAVNVEGGYNAYEKLLKSSAPIEIDAKGLKCPGPVVKVADTVRTLKTGQSVHVQATEDAFVSDIAVWCDRTGNKLVSLEQKNGVIDAVIKKQEPPKTELTKRPDGKTFVVFSGDLDKTIAAFIMANGAASMGRQVTIFFTFWGLNILRSPKKVKVKKSFVESMFGFMMPRGSKKLGLSRMNMGGMGAKMIRAVMKSKNVSSLEELMQSAIDHGVRLVACQMSMEIMGIRREELIDGVELGGVATFLGSGEQSDMSLFI
ncbi:MAG: DsrE/DsrF/DrsH-like family protein [Ruminococcus sp.]|nr:DsrE/DsrF/DrsH-like family protein [Ruminococcus sp.]